MSHFNEIFGNTDVDMKGIVSNLEELVFVWETCKKRGLWYKDNVFM